MSLVKRLAKKARGVAHKVEHVALKAATPGLSSKTEKKIEHVVDKAQSVQSGLAKAAAHPSAHNVAKAARPVLSKKQDARLEHTLKVGQHFEGLVGKAALHPTHHNITAVKDQSKIVTRNIMRSGEKPIIYATGGIVAVASYFFTPVAGAALGAGLSSANYYVGATAARAKGKHGQAARKEGRLVRKKSINAALIGMSVGAGAALVGAAAAGSAAAAGVGSGASAIVGPAATSSITSIGGAAISAAGKIVPAVIQHPSPVAAGAGQPRPIQVLPDPGGRGLPAGSPAAEGAAQEKKTDWALIALGGAALLSMAA